MWIHKHFKNCLTWAGGVAQAAELLPHKCEALSSNPSTTTTKKKKKRKKLLDIYCLINCYYFTEKSEVIEYELPRFFPLPNLSHAYFYLFHSWKMLLL
jgi:hypothetical protein